MIDQMVSHYKILEKLGEGGMGVVYKAHDTTLERDVALKFLPSHLSASGQDKARFMQEAKAAATLDHPNICTIHSIEEHEGRLFIAMQFVDGHLLRDRMSGMSQKQALEIGIQVAEGLAAAHEKGVVHRDIKPENIMVRKDGIVQIMDFGLAKLKGVSRLTKEGSTVGTAGYMSPEQIQGQDADHRSDIFSLGVLLYEMLTGQLPFKGVHETAIAYEIVNVDATPMSAIKPETNPDLDRIVLECLEKEPSERFQSAAEIAKELKRYKRESSRQRTTRTIPARQFRTPSDAFQESPARLENPAKRFLWPAISVLLGLALVLILAVRPAERQSEIPVLRLPINLPQWAPAVLAAASLALSPDGSHLAYLAGTQGAGSGITGLSSMLYLRPLDDFSIKQMPGTEGASDPFFSADGKWVAFFSSGELRKVSIFGGATQTICALPGFMRGGWWASDNTIWFGHLNSSIYRVPAEGGIPEPATVVDTARGEVSHRFPQTLPGNEWVLFTVKYNNIVSFDDAAIVAENVETHERKELVRGGSFGRYVPTGHIMYARDTSIFAVPFDREKVEVTGPPLPVLEGGMLNPMSGTANYEVSQTGILIYTPTGPRTGLTNDLAWMDRNGTIAKIPITPGPYDDARLSPDNSKIAMTIRAANDDIWVYDMARGTLTRITFGGGNSGLPEWTPDGGKVSFLSERRTETGLFWKPWDGSGMAERLGKEGNPTGLFRSCFARGGKSIIYGANGDLWEMSLEGERSTKPILQKSSADDAPRLSRDGNLLAYLSDESGRNEVYIVPYPDMNGKWQISTGGANSPPIWSPRGTELFFAGDGDLMKVDVRTTPNVTFSRPQKVCDLPSSLFGLYDIALDGERFLITLSVESNDPSMTQLNVVVGWFDELTHKFSSLRKDG